VVARETPQFVVVRNKPDFVSQLPIKRVAVYLLAFITVRKFEIHRRD
jgi:hypothetical protein